MTFHSAGSRHPAVAAIFAMLAFIWLTAAIAVPVSAQEASAEDMAQARNREGRHDISGKEQSPDDVITG